MSIFQKKARTKIVIVGTRGFCQNGEAVKRCLDYSNELLKYTTVPEIDYAAGFIAGKIYGELKNGNINIRESEIIMEFVNMQYQGIRQAASRRGS